MSLSAPYNHQEQAKVLASYPNGDRATPGGNKLKLQLALNDHRLP